MTRLQGSGKGRKISRPLTDCDIISANMSYEWFISLRYLKAKRKQTFISLITIISVFGVAIGVTALIVVLAVMTGAQDDIKEKIVGANSHILVTARSASLGKSDVTKVVETAMSIKDVKSASAFIFNQVIATSSEKVAGVALRGIDVSSPGRTADIKKFMEEGELEFLQDRYTKSTIEPDDFGTRVEVKRSGIILGRELAVNLRVRVGDPVTIVSAMGRMTPSGMVPISREYYVVGLFHTGMYEYDSALALVSLGQAQSLFKMGGKVTGVEIRVKDIYLAPQIADSIRGKLGFEFKVRDWQQLNRNLFFALALEKTVIGLILVLIIFVAAFNIVSTLIMVVLEKSKDIAILKAMGASSRSVMKIFFLEGFTIGALGIIIGDIGGVILCEILDRYHFIKLPTDVYNLDTLPVSMRIEDIALISLAALVITVLAALYPAWSASRIDPAESLRYG